MEHDELVGQLQQRARLDSRGHAERAARATLETLGERLTAGAAGNLADQLPIELGDHLRATAVAHGEEPEPFDSDEFLDRVSERERVDLPVAAFHARAVLEMVDEATTGGTLQKVRQQLPDDYDRLFEAGAAGKMP